MEGEMKNLTELLLSVMAALSYCYFVTSRFPKGMFRLFSLLPIFFLFSVAPLHLTFAFNTAVATFFLTWLANFKLLLFSFGSGPLCPDPNLNPPLSLPLFITFACLPIRSKQSKDRFDSSKPTKPKLKLPLNLATESIVLPVLLGVLHNYRDFVISIHPKFILVIYCCAIFLLVDVLIAISNAAARALLGLELEPPSDEPYLATSLQDFWGRRWNLMVTNILRISIYKPVRSAASCVVGSAVAPLPAVLAAFLVSGLMHELLFYYVTRASPTWEMTGFFVLQGVCVVIEFGLKKVVAGRFRLPTAVSTAATVGFVVATSFWLFFPPLVDGGADAKVMEEFFMFGAFIKSKLPLQLLKIFDR